MACLVRGCKVFTRVQAVLVVVRCNTYASYVSNSLSPVCYALRFGQSRSRVNGISTEWFEEDVRAVAKSGADAVLLPKTESTNDISRLQDLLVKHDAPVEQEICACCTEICA